MGDFISVPDYFRKKYPGNPKLRLPGREFLHHTEGSLATPATCGMASIAILGGRRMSAWLARGKCAVVTVLAGRHTSMVIGYARPARRPVTCYAVVADGMRAGFACGQ